MLRAMADGLSDPKDESRYEEVGHNCLAAHRCEGVTYALVRRLERLAYMVDLLQPSDGLA